MKLVLTLRPEWRTHLPDLATLVKQYHVTPDYAFHLLRPFMNDFYVSQSLPNFSNVAYVKNRPMLFNERKLRNK